MTVLQRIIDAVSPEPQSPRELYFRDEHNAGKFRAALKDKSVKVQAWQTEKGMAIKPLEVPKFKEALAARGLMNDPYVQHIVDTLDKSANNYVEFQYER